MFKYSILKIVFLFVYSLIFSACTEQSIPNLAIQTSAQNTIDTVQISPDSIEIFNVVDTLEQGPIENFDSLVVESSKATLPVDSTSEDSYLGYKVYFDGVDQITEINSQIEINRFNPPTLDLIEKELGIELKKRAMSNVGVKIRFKTNSRNIKMVFSERIEPIHLSPEYFQPEIFENGLKVATDYVGLSFTHQVRSILDTNLIEVYLPNQFGFNSNLIELDSNTTTFSSKSKDSTIALIGDSNGAGVVGMTTNSSMLWLNYIGEFKNSNTYNLAIPESRAIMTYVHSLVNKEIDQLLIMYGTNSYQAQIPLDEFRRNYAGLLAGIRVYQPSVPITCLTPIQYSFDLQEIYSQPLQNEMEDYIEVIEEECNLIPNSQIIHTAEFVQGEYISPDGVHMTEFAHKPFAEWLISKL